LWRALGQHFRDPRLQQLFGRYATYCGSSPFLAPATLMLVAHVEQAGVWLVDGGMHRIACALESLAQTRGARFRYDAEVTEVIERGGRATGVRLFTGERIDADAVIINADVAAVARGRFGTPVSRVTPPTPHDARSLSAVTWNLVARTEGFPLLRHTVFFSRDYPAEFEDILRHDRIPSEPTVYVCAQDRDDRGDTRPSSPERLLCLVNAPASGDTRAFDAAEIARCEARAFALLERCGLQVERSPGQCVVTTPADFERLFPSTGGALYGRASHGWTASFQRPNARSRMEGLYHAGGSVHPGPGVPMAALSGRLAARALLEDAGAA
jgi:1-hydroxycarotenoid 3,4-desaturase